MKKFGHIVMIGIILALVLTACQGNAQGQFETVEAATGSLAARVGATGTVRSNHSAQLTWQTSGTVESVAVKIGDQVKRGDTLALLQTLSLPQNIIMAEAELLSAQQELDELQNSGISLAKVEQELAEAQKAFDDAEDKYDGIKYQRASDTYIENTQARLDLANRRVSQMRKNYAIFEKLPDGDSRKAEALSAMTSAELSRDQLVAELNYVTGSPDSTEAAQRKADYDVAKAELDNAKRRLEQMEDGIDPVELASVRARLAAAQASLNLARVIAPFDGTITDADVVPGDQVNAGKIAFRLDDLSRFLVDVEVSEIDINAVEVGQPVEVSFDAIQGASYQGIVVEVGRAGTVTQGAVNFTVTVELTDADEAVKPGMTAAVTILVQQLDDVLLVPNRAVRVVDGERVVYILKDGMPTAVDITLGATSDSESEVLIGDLKPGDLIVLNPPVNFAPQPARPGGN